MDKNKEVLDRVNRLKQIINEITEIININKKEAPEVEIPIESIERLVKAIYPVIAKKEKK